MLCGSDSMTRGRPCSLSRVRGGSPPIRGLISGGEDALSQLWDPLPP